MKFGKNCIALLSLFILIMMVGLAYAENDLQLSLDYAMFRYDQNANFVELYYEINQKFGSIHEIKNDREWIISYDFKVLRNDTLWVENQWETTKSLTNDIDLKNGAVMKGRIFYLAPEGDYQIQLTANDKKNPSISTSSQFSLSISPFRMDVLEISDIEIASSIEYNAKKDPDNPFYKNSLIVTPHPTLVFGGEKNILYYYCEFYNVLNGIKDETYFVKTTVVNENNEPIENKPPVMKMKKRQADSVVEIGEMGLFGLASGPYFLLLEIQDQNQKTLASEIKKFYIFDPDNIAEGEEYTIDPAKQFNMSHFNQMDSLQVNNEFEYIQYIVPASQKQVYNNCFTLSAKRKFLFDFWLTFDKNRQNANNDAYQNYMKRVSYANMNFGTMQRQGWKTAFGRVYLIYGNPNDIERFPSVGGTAPYEIWSYENIEGGVIFVFADFTGYKEYRLIHSTKQGEPYNDNYQELLNRKY